MNWVNLNEKRSKRLRAKANNHALFDISAAILEGRCCTICGPPGIGKSTSLRGFANGVAEGEARGVNFSKTIFGTCSHSFNRSSQRM